MPKKVKVQLEVFSELRGSPPDVPLAEGINYEELVAADLAEDQQPMFVTLPLAQFGQVSRNKRQYPEAEVRRMYEQILSNAVTGGLGHLRNEDRSYRFDIPVVKWVGAEVVGQELWGKMYVLSHRKDVREYMRVQKATNGKVGTSLYALAYENYDEERDVYEISDIELEQIDVVHPARVGVLFTATNPPYITSETIQEAEPGEVEVGDYVSWERDGNLIRGQINTIWTEGEVEIPYQDMPALPASEDNPIARMDVFEPNFHGKGWLRTSWQVIQYVSELTKIEPLPLPETVQETEALSERLNSAIDDMVDDEVSRTDIIDRMASAAGIDSSTVNQILNNSIDKPPLERLRGFAQVLDVEFEELARLAGYDEDEIGQEEDTEMTKKAESNQDTDTRIVELQEAHEDQVRELNLKITKLDKQSRTFKRLCEMLEVAEDADPVLALQAKLTQLEAAQKENSDLLKTAIESEVTKAVAVDWVRPNVIEMVTQLHPQSRAEVTACVQEALKNESIKLILKNAVQKESGPPQTTPTQTPDPEDADDDLILIPSVGENS